MNDYVAIMDAFELGIDRAKFSSTNAAWNKLMLNDPWSVGYVSTLIELQAWHSKEEWEDFYYKSGEQRRALLGNNRDLLDNFSLIRTNRAAVNSLPWDIKNLNTQYGRTREDLKKRAEALYSAMCNKRRDLTPEECEECVRFRVICETRNGIILRENNTIAVLTARFPMLSFEKTSGEIDHTYAVDFEVFRSGSLICGIQIKPKSYTWNAPYIEKARTANIAKNAAYTNLKGVPVFDVISLSNGEIQNPQVLEQITSLV